MNGHTSNLSMMQRMSVRSKVMMVLSFVLLAMLTHYIWQYTRLKGVEKNAVESKRHRIQGAEKKRWREATSNLTPQKKGEETPSQELLDHPFLYGESRRRGDNLNTRQPGGEMLPSPHPPPPPPPPAAPGHLVSDDYVSTPCNLVNFSQNRLMQPSDYVDLGAVPSFFTRLTKFMPDATTVDGGSGTVDGVPRPTEDASHGGRRQPFPRPVLLDMPSFPPSSKPKATPKNVFFFHMYNLVKSHRRLCSIESFLQKNPDYKVFVYALNLRFFKQSWSERSNPQVRLVKINYTDIFQGTPFEQWYSSGAYMNSRWVKMNLGNACRLAVLWKKGGTYLDLDVISLKPQLPGLQKAVASEHISSINCAFLRYPAGDGFLWECMKDFVISWNGMKWGIQGPQLTSRMYFRFCQDVVATKKWLETVANVSQKARLQFDQRYSELSVERLSPYYLAPSFCRDFTVLEPDSVYPIHFKLHNAMFYNWKDQCETVVRMNDKSFLFHYWDHFFMDRVRFQHDSLMAKVMQETCPNAFNRYNTKSLRQ